MERQSTKPKVQTKGDKGEDIDKERKRGSRLLDAIF
jgi:hypothetical protein